LIFGIYTGQIGGCENLGLFPKMEVSQDKRISYCKRNLAQIVTHYQSSKRSLHSILTNFVSLKSDCKVVRLALMSQSMTIDLLLWQRYALET